MDGIILFNKPILWTSHDAVDFARRVFGQKSVGHAGTLDPMATGLLILLAGSATKRQSELMGLDKEYRGTFSLGVRTDTLDLEGQILGQTDARAVARESVEAALAGFVGEGLQSPPAYSAVKVGGQKLYAAARKGAPVAAAARPIRIERFELESFYEGEAAFRLVCSKGTYVRSLCEAVGEKLGCGAALSSLVRTRIGPYHLKDAKDRESLSRI